MKHRKPFIYKMPGARIELAQRKRRGILSPLRLPIPPPRHKKIYYIFSANYTNFAGACQT